MSIASKPNKVKFNLKNVYVAELIENDGQYSFGTPKAFPGAVSISLDPEGESTPFYADDIVYFRSNGNNGYLNNNNMYNSNLALPVANYSKRNGHKDLHRHLPGLPREQAQKPGQRLLRAALGERPQAARAGLC